MAQLAHLNRSHWQLPEPVDSSAAAALGLNPVLATLLAQRGLTTAAAVRAYLDHTWTWQPHHWSWPDLQTATARLVQAIETGEPMAIYGDYDADGVTATAVLYAFLRRLGANVVCHLPHRMHDGYGLNVAALDRLAEMGRRLVITVDNGVSAVAEIAHANRIGLEVIVTDHHTPPAELPAALAMVNPKCYDPELAVLAGCGVAWLLCRSLQRATGRGDADALLDIVAMGSVADQVPLTGINRHLVHRGLQQMHAGLRPGVRALLTRAGRDVDQPLTAQDIAFVIGPRLNAAGRLEHPQLAVDLLLAADDTEAERLAEQLEQLNQRRRLLTDEMTAHAQTMIDTDCDLSVDRVLVLGSASWHHGIAGIVAARLAETYQRPVIVCCQDGDVWRGSGRSPAWIDLHGLLKANEQWLARFGGHKQAAGCSLPLANLEPLRRGLNRTLRESLADLGAQRLDVDLTVPLATVSPALVEELGRLEPTGQGNPLPRFGATEVHVLEASLRGARSDVLIADLSDSTHAFRAVGLGAAGVMPLPERVDIVYRPEFNHFRGQTSVQLRLHGIGPAASLGAVETTPPPQEPTTTLPGPAPDLDVRDARHGAATLLQTTADREGWAVWMPGGHQAGSPVDDEASLTALPAATDLVLAGYPADEGALLRAIERTGARRLHLALPPLADDLMLAIDPAMMNQAYRQLKTLEGLALSELPGEQWPMPASLFPDVWQALREAGLVLIQGDRWHRLQPSGRVPLADLPTVQARSRRQTFWRWLAEADPDTIRTRLIELLAERPA